MDSELTIGIVTRNRAEILEDTLKHLRDLELEEKILVIDGSDGEKTEKVCSEFDIDYYRQKSQGMTSARNEALEKCQTDYIAFIDDDTRVSESWYETIQETFSEDKVVGVTGKLLGEELDFSGLSGIIREIMNGGRDSFGEIKDNGVINGDFFYEERKEVDHMPGCNMAYDVEALESVGGFEERIDVGNSYREDTIASYRVNTKGKIIYDPEASVDHLKVEEEGDHKKWMFYNPYLTRYFLTEENVIKGWKNHLSHLFVTLLRHNYFLGSNFVKLETNYLYYLYGEIRGFLDFVVSNREPRKYV